MCETKEIPEDLKINSADMSSSSSETEKDVNAT